MDQKEIAPSTTLGSLKRRLKRLSIKKDGIKEKNPQESPFIKTQVDQSSPLEGSTLPSIEYPEDQKADQTIRPEAEDPRRLDLTRTRSVKNCPLPTLKVCKKTPFVSLRQKEKSTVAQFAEKIKGILLSTHRHKQAANHPLEGRSTIEGMDGKMEEDPQMWSGANGQMVPRSISAPLALNRSRSKSASSSHTRRMHTFRLNEDLFGSIPSVLENGYHTSPRPSPKLTPQLRAANGDAASANMSLFGILEQSLDAPGRDGIVVFSGGSAANAISDVFGALGRDVAGSITYLIGVSDNGGSTSEIIRMIGGPGIGDIRSRLVRLIPDASNGKVRGKVQKAQENIRGMMNLRLDISDQSRAQAEFDKLCAGAHELWENVDAERKEVIRNIFITVQSEILKRTRYPSSRFDFRNASVGNLFLTGARLFTGSVESAIWLMRKACNIPDEAAEVWPVISRNFTNHIAAGLENGEVIIGQNDISHPSEESEETKSLLYTEDFYAWEEREDANWPGSHKRLKGGDVFFDKTEDRELESRIQRVWYVNPYGHEVRPRASQKVVEALESARVVVYSIGSFWTSLIPTVIPHPTPGLLSRPSIQAKVFLLNNSLDREVSPHSPEQYRASTFLIKLAEALQYCLPVNHPWSTDNCDFAPEVHVKLFVTHVLVMDEIGWHSDEQDIEVLRRLGVKRVAIKVIPDENGVYTYDLQSLEDALKTIYEEELNIV